MAEQAISCLVFACGHHAYAVPAERASEIVTFGELTDLPSAAPHLRGLLAHRGEVIPVVDLGVLRDGAPADTQRAILIRTPRGAFALTASQVFGLAGVPVKSTAPRLGADGFLALLSGPFHARDQDAALIDLDGLLGLLAQSAHDAQGGPSST